MLQLGATSLPREICASRRRRSTFRLTSCPPTRGLAGVAFVFNLTAPTTHTHCSHVASRTRDESHAPAVTTSSAANTPRRKHALTTRRAQAAESLSMNGRALNDRAIEVAPSSSRVLDRAAGSQPPGGPPLLTPFPPSKNRPRPGDWTCPSCGFSNFQRRTACFRCSFPGMFGAPKCGRSLTAPRTPILLRRDRAHWRCRSCRSISAARLPLAPSSQPTKL